MTWYPDAPQGNEAAKCRFDVLPYLARGGVDIGCGGLLTSRGIEYLFSLARPRGKAIFVALIWGRVSVAPRLSLHEQCHRGREPQGWKW